MSTTRTTTRATRKQQAGVSLLGLIIAIVIVAALVAAIISQGRQTRDQTNATTELNNVGMTISMLEKFKQNGTYGANGTDLIPALRVSKKIPASWADNGTTVTDSFKGQVTAVAANNSGFTLTLGGLPSDACQALAMGISGNALMGTSINGGAQLTGQVSQAQATAQCSTDSNSIAWTDNT